VAIISKYCDGPTGPGGGNDQVSRVPSIDGARLNHQTERRRDKSKRSWPRSDLHVNPIDAHAANALPRLNAGCVRAEVTVKICNRELWPGAGRGDRRIRNVCGFCRAAACQNKQHQQRHPQNQAAQCQPVIHGVYSRGGFVRQLRHEALLAPSVRDYTTQNVAGKGAIGTRAVARNDGKT
jgi:hypothetical protein